MSHTSCQANVALGTTCVEHFHVNSTSSQDLQHRVGLVVLWENHGKKPKSKLWFFLGFYHEICWVFLCSFCFQPLLRAKQWEGMTIGPDSFANRRSGKICSAIWGRTSGQRTSFAWAPWPWELSRRVSDIPKMDRFFLLCFTSLVMNHGESW